MLLSQTFVDVAVGGVRICNKPEAGILAGGTGSTAPYATVTLAATASLVDDYYTGYTIMITSGTGRSFPIHVSPNPALAVDRPVSNVESVPKPQTIPTPSPLLIFSRGCRYSASCPGTGNVNCAVQSVVRKYVASTR